MTIARTTEYLRGLLVELRKLFKETEWVEFKHNVAEPEEIGEYISALANSAALCGKANAYLVWGIDDVSHNVVGTAFRPSTTKIGNEELEPWLLRHLNPKIDFRFFEFEVEGRSVVMLEIGRAFRHPVQFKTQEFVRVGSYKKKLKDFPEKERALWRIFDSTPFEDLTAAEHVDADEVLRLLDYPAYFDLLKQSLPESKQGILTALASDGMIVPELSGKWNINNLGAILLAKRLDEFKGLKRKISARGGLQGHESHGNCAGTSRRKRLRCRFRGPDWFCKHVPADERSCWPCDSQDRSDVPRNCHPGTGRQCAYSSGLFRDRRRSHGGNLQRPNGDCQSRIAFG